MTVRATVSLLALASLAACGGADPTPPLVQGTAEAPAAPEVAGSWLARAQQAIAAREYEASESRHSLQAPNRRHDLRTWFEPTGVHVVDRKAQDAALADLSLASIGRNGQAQPVAAGEVSHAGVRVEIRRPGLVEWYDNSPAGLEQGFTLEARPPGDGSLVFALAVGAAEAGLRGDSVVLRTPTGRKLAYGALAATDATGRTLAAHFEVPRSDRIELVVDDHDATYPLTIDPLLTATADTQLDVDQTGAGLSDVAGAGDVNGDGYADVIVGASRYDAGETDEGAAFIFLGSASGIADGNPAVAHAQLEGNQPGAYFGLSVAAAGDVNGDGYADVIVGASSYDAGEVDEGAAFVFHGSALGIADGSPATADTRLEANQADSYFGGSVASAGDVNGDGYDDVIVGAVFYDAGEVDEGAAFVFHGSASGIADGSPATADTRLEANQADSYFGGSVASAGDVNGDGYDDVIVGASQYEFDLVILDRGAAFVFLGSASGIADGNPATADTRLDGAQADSRFGFSVAGAGDVNGDGYADVIVGAWLYNRPELDEGAAFVFLGSASGIADGDPTTADSLLEANQPGAAFGWSVSGAGDVNGDGYADVIVGGSDYDWGSNRGDGGAFVFLGSASGIADGSPVSAHAQLAPSHDYGGSFGKAVAAAGDVNGDGYADVLVGDSTGGPTSQVGTAFVYLGGASGIANGGTRTPDAEIQSNQVGGNLGGSVASAGDVNGDGYADIIIGAAYYDLGESNEGAAFVFPGGPAGISDGNPISAATLLQSNQVAAYFGTSVASAGDVNGDGYSDIIVGAPYYNAGESDEGAAFVYLGSAAGIADGDPSTADARIESNQTNGFLGNSVAGAGDVNGDGYADVIVGAQVYDDGETNEGAAFVFQGSAAGIAGGDPTTADARIESNQANAFLGWSVAGAGDVNGDGYADVIVGAIQYAAGQSGEGAAFVFLGSAAGIADGDPATAGAQLESNQPNAHLGWSVAGAGDVNGDGYADVIVGAPDIDLPDTDEGAAFVFLGSASGIADGSPTSADAQLESNQASARLGTSVASAGDVNGDGYSDVIVGATQFHFTYPFTDAGGAFVFLGSASGIADGSPATAATELQSDQATADFGTSVASAGDVNGDGYADVIVGAPQYADPQTQEGAAFVFLGNGAGHPDLARQRRGDASGVPVAPWGASQSSDGFEVEISAHHPGGRGLVKLESEACPAGVAFGDPACTVETSPSWTLVDGTSPDATLAETFAGLDVDTLYRWRARVLRMPVRASLPGITPPPNPAHGPWRRLDAQASEADVRVLPEPGVLWMTLAGTLLLARLSRGRRAPGGWSHSLPRHIRSSTG